MIQFKKMISSLLSLTTAAAMGLGIAGTAYASPISTASVVIANAKVASSTSYTIQFTASTTSIYGIKVSFRQKPSNDNAIPTGMGLGSATLTSAIDSGNSNADLTATPGWTLDASAGGTNGDLVLANTTPTAYSPGGTPTYKLVIANVTNPTDANECDSVTNSESCYIVITTYTNSGLTTPADNGAISFTVFSGTTVTATVDPSLTFTVNGVTTHGTIQTNDSGAGCASSADVAASATSLPFGNIKPATPVCAQQSLAVATNAAQGYTTYQRSTTAGAAAGAVMQGTINSSNVIAGFSGNSATWAVPAAWATPTSTTPNTNTGWMGVRTTNAGVSGSIPTFTSGQYGTPYIATTLTPSAGTAVKLMDKAGADLGTSPTYVTYKLEVNAAQPADTYSGTVIYNVVAKY